MVVSNRRWILRIEELEKKVEEQAEKIEEQDKRILKQETKIEEMTVKLRNKQDQHDPYPFSSVE